MNDVPDRAYAAAAACLASLGPRRLGQLIAEHGAAAQLWAAVSGDIASVAIDRWRSKYPDVRSTLAEQAGRIRPSSVWQRCLDAGIDVVVRGDAGYPAVLEDDPEPPSVLFVRGSLAGAMPRRVGVVGTRNATENGRRFAHQLGRDLGDAGICVVSGLARGIDAAAHRGVLRGQCAAGPLAVVGCGLDVVFPRENRELWEQVADRGALLSEYGPGVEPLAHHFPARNRIIAGLSEVVVVVESREAGGSLLTVKEALKRQIDVLAVPGSPLNRAAQGTNRIIADGARPVLDTQDVLMALGLDTRRQGVLRFDPRPTPTTADQMVLDAFGGDTLTLDEIVLRVGAALGEVAMALGRLELAGWVHNDCGWLTPLRSGAVPTRNADGELPS